MSEYRPLSYEEKVHLMIILFKPLNVDIESIKDVLACNDFNLIEKHMDDIGITITYNSVATDISITTFNDDKEWSNRKLKMLWEHFKV